MAERFNGLQKYVESEFIDKNYEQAAVIMLNHAVDYEAGVILTKTWGCIKGMVADTPNMKIVQQLIEEAYARYAQDVKAGNVEQEDIELIEKQVKFYNMMVDRAYKEAKKEGLIVAEEGIGYKSHSKQSLDEFTQELTSEDEQLELK